MTVDLATGARVVHPELGPGVVARVQRQGRSLAVRFDASPALLLEVPARELAAEAGRTASPAGEEPPAAEASGSAPSPEGGAPAAPPRLLGGAAERAPFRRPPGAGRAVPASLPARRTLEALRLGVVPHGDLRSASVGRERELAQVRADLDEAAERGSLRVFLGDYGAGKTHMLELAEREALAAGFLVGRVTLDAEWVQPNQPMRIYRSVVTSLAYPDLDAAARGLEPLLEKAISRPELVAGVVDGKDPFHRHLYLAPALVYRAALADVDDPQPRDLLVDWISGQRPEGNRELDAALRRLARQEQGLAGGPRIYALKDFQPWAHVYSYLLGGVSTLARRLGYRGLTVLLDEAENYDLLGSAARAFADSAFRCLSLAALGEEGVRFDSATIDKGGFAPQRRLPLLFDWPQHLYLVAAMTPSTAGEELLRSLVPEARLVELSPLHLEDYHELSRRVTALFEAAHPEMRLPERVGRPLGKVLWSLLESGRVDSPRDATKLTVEFLDLLRLRPAALAGFFADLERALDG